MIYFLHYLTGWFSPLRVTQYVSFRAGGALVSSFLLAIAFGPRVIHWLHSLNMRGLDRTEGVEGLEHRSRKVGTPSMGGVLIVGSVTLSTLVWARSSEPLIWCALVGFVGLGLVGAVDDWRKVQRRGGLCGKAKLISQMLIGLGIGSILTYAPLEKGEALRSLYLPFLKNPVVLDMGPLAVLFFALVLVASSNAVNLTDGMDGLAVGCVVTSSGAYLVMAYVAGHALFSEYLIVPYVPGSSELAVFCGSLVGAGLGFLWFNCHPASVFMGDTGSLALGGAIGLVAGMIRQELVLIFVGGVFVMEAVSVILQVSVFKATRRRLFRCAPVHHHFELSKWTETQVTVRFWILSLLFALIGLGTLKIR